MGQGAENLVMIIAFFLVVAVISLVEVLIF